MLNGRMLNRISFGFNFWLKVKTFYNNNIMSTATSKYNTKKFLDIYKYVLRFLDMYKFVSALICGYVSGFDHSQHITYQYFFPSAGDVPR